MNMSEAGKKMGAEEEMESIVMEGRMGERKREREEE